MKVFDEYDFPNGYPWSMLDMQWDIGRGVFTSTFVENLRHGMPPNLKGKAISFFKTIIWWLWIMLLKYHLMKNFTNERIRKQHIIETPYIGSLFKGVHVRVMF